jgi:hypothetical protein
MAVISNRTFGGISPRTSARYLQDTQAQTALNCTVFAGSLLPLKNYGSTVATASKVGTPATIYRFGQDAASDSQYWFNFLTDVDVCRSQIAGDTSEWTFYTDGTLPKATYNTLALSGSDYPYVSRPLGLPAPASGATASAGGSIATVVTLYSSILANLVSGYKIQVSLVTPTGDASFTGSSITIVTATPEGIASQITAMTDLDAVVSGTSIVVSRTGATPGYTFYLRYQTGLTSGGSPVPIYATIASSTDNVLAETRVYTYTYVSKESGFEFESAPAPASTDVTVSSGQAVTVTSFATLPSGYNITHKRIYRSTAGSFLFVAEISAATSSYTDTKLAEDLAEEVPSTTWLMPPATLKGLINMPNGYMAGFTGRDVYFSDPYHPAAWPIGYMQSFDFPVVGLGRMDTTLAVLTTGVPYFVQGTTPDAVTIVKTDVEQSCAAKRSIVSVNGSVIYASPDGLVMLSQGGSKLITERMFTRAQWQSLFLPSSIEAYQHDLKYVAFYNNGSTSGGFIYDLTTGEFATNDIYATAGYNDLLNDNLYLAFADRSIKVWLGGSNKTATWKSKKFTMPYSMYFSCAQVDAETYPVTAKFYAEGNLIHTQTVASRLPFRLPSAVGKDWEIQIETEYEVFGYAMAQSMEELRGV